jgi:hypothetical protein
VNAVAVHFSGSVGQPPAGDAAQKLAALYRLADPEQRQQIEATVRAALAQAERAQGQTTLTLRLAAEASEGGTWHTVQFQIVEQDD